MKVKTMRLTARQRQIIEQIEAGKTTEEIAKALGIGKWTVKGHVRTLCRAFDCAMYELPVKVREA